MAKSVLQDLGDTLISMRVTLSYFVEPSPGRRGWTDRHRYQSHGLRFDVIRPLETVDQFRRRVSSADWNSPRERPEAVGETRNWVVGDKGRTHGSLHCDWWDGTAAELAECGRIAVYPVTGWWRERSHLDRWGRRARYSLVVTIETPRLDVNLYARIVSDSTIATEIPI